MNHINGAYLTVSGGYGASVLGSTDANGFFSLALKPVNIGGPFPIKVSAKYGAVTKIFDVGTLEVRAKIVVPADKVLEGTIIAGVTGTMPNRSGNNNALAISRSGTTLRFRSPKGYYDGVDDTVQYSDPNFVASNIVSGKTIFGLTGTAPIGKRYATGVLANDGLEVHDRRRYSVAEYYGLNFTPKMVIMVSESPLINNQRFFSIAVKDENLNTLIATSGQTDNVWKDGTHFQTWTLPFNVIDIFSYDMYTIDLFSNGFRLLTPWKHNFGGTIRWYAFGD